MILAGNQPYFLPYLGYWQLIHASDVFEISDDYQYIDSQWINRNRILINGKPSYFRVELLHATSNKMINELFVQEISINKKIQQIQCAYGRAPFFEQGLALVRRILSCQEKNLAVFLTNSIEIVCEYLGITTELVLSSNLKHNSDYKREFRIYDMCQRLGADTYYNAIGGQHLYSFEEFEKRGIKLAFLKMGDICYHQFYGQEFVPNLSILDVIMFNSVEKIQKMLNAYTLIENESQ